MGLKLVMFTLVLCAVMMKTRSDGNCDHRRRMPEYVRIKRAKYFSNPPPRFYRQPPMTYPIKGPFSYTPPPNYRENELQYPANLRPLKVSKRPTNDGLGDEDINNIVKYLSKTDLDKIIEFAGEKERYAEKYRGESNEIEYSRPMRPDGNRENVQGIDNSQRFTVNNAYGQSVTDAKQFQHEYNRPHINYVRETRTPNKDDDRQKFSLNGPYIGNGQNEIPFKVEYNNPNIHVRQAMQLEKQITNNLRSPYNGPYSNDDQDEKDFQFDNNSPNPNINYNINQQAVRPSKTNAALSNYPLETEESMKNIKISFFDAQMKELASKDVFTDSSVMEEESLPLPANLRQEDYELSYTNKVPKIVKPDPDSYEVESFGDLPLMNYHNSKLHTVSSYHVPHYTVTSPAPPHRPPHSKPSSSLSPDNSPLLERAPPGADGKDQSDAHLKAIRIWTHRSKGTAYTLHSDGTLSLEAPKRPKPYYHP